MLTDKRKEKSKSTPDQRAPIAHICQNAAQYSTAHAHLRLYAHLGKTFLPSKPNFNVGCSWETVRVPGAFSTSP